MSHRRKLFQGLFFYFISALFIPFPIIMLPAAKLTATLGLDNQAGMILLYTVYGLSFNVFLYTAYIDEPLERAAAAAGISLCIGKVDGLSSLEREINRLCASLF